MKIIVDARLYGLENAGLGRYVINLVRELSEIDKKNKYVILLRKKYFDKLELPPNWKKVLTDFRHYSLLEQIRLPAILIREKPDIVHFPHFNVPVFYKGKFVVTIHDLLMHKFRGREATTLPFYKYFPKRALYKFVFDKAVKKSAKIIVPSNFIKKELEAYYKNVDKNKAVVTYEGVDDAVFPKGQASTILKKYKLKTDYFIYVGNAYPHKNLMRAAEALVSINKRQKRRAIFAIVSARNVFTERLGGLAEKLGVDKYVRLLGFVPDDELGVLYKNSLGFVYPSLSEGFGLPGLEAISAGALVSASDIPVFKEVYKDNVLYFNPYDFSSIEKSMEEAMDMASEERAEMIEKGQKFIKRYSWSKMAKQTLKVYEEAVRV